MARRKVKNGEKTPWGQCLTRPVPNGRRSSAFWLVPENFCVFLPNQNAERGRPFGTGLVRHCPQGLFSSFFTFLCAIFFRPFRLSLAPTICPWVFEDGKLVIWRRRLTSYFKLIFIYEQWLVITASWEDLAAVVFVSNKFLSSCAICLVIAREVFQASVGLFDDDKSA